MSKLVEKRERTAAKIAGMGCAVQPAMFDSRSGSYGIGRADNSGYFTPTFPSEAATLDWAARNLHRIERHLSRGEPIEPNEFIAHLAAAAAAESGADADAFAAFLEPRMKEIRAEASLIGERELDHVLDEIECSDRSVADSLEGLSDLLGVQIPLPSTPQA